MKIEYIPIKDDFSLDYGKAEEMIDENTALVCLTHVSNVLGTVNDVLSAESVALETQEMFRALSRNLQPGITQQQADEITRYLKAIADNTDQ